MSWNVADVKLFEGRLARTSAQMVQIASDSGESFPAELQRSINLATDSELLDQWASGELHVVEDPHTGANYRLVMPIVCHDPRRRVFVLVVPDELRWLESRLRAQLLEELDREPVEVPRYVREFGVVYDIGRLRELESGVLEPATFMSGGDPELQRQRQAIETEREQLRVEREQLDAVRERFDKERERMDELQTTLQSERRELARLREELDQSRLESTAAKLNEEGRALEAARSGSSQTEESTQVVTEDQIIIVDDSELEESFAEESEVEVEEVSPHDAFSVVTIEPSDRAPQKLRDLLGKGRNRAVKIVRSRVMAVAQLEPERVARLIAGEPAFFIQLHDVDGFPVVSLLLAQLDDDHRPTELFNWPLDPSSDGDRLIIDRLKREAILTLSFYDPTGERIDALDVRTPLASNVGWIGSRADEMLRTATTRYDDALARFEADDFQHLGKMRHNFTANSFADLDSPSEIRLATGIVGYWSEEEQFDYLVSNLSFPLHQFRTIQERVVRRAADAGIAMNRPLRRVALEMRIAPNEESLVELLVANFAEASISIRKNDLEPADQWANWEALLGLGDELGVPADPDVVELAEVSLKRAQEAEELVEKFENETTTIEDPRRRFARDEHVVAKQSESTGVTYFLPHDAVLDTFDDLASMPRDDLELLLNDKNGRLEAAQMLIERFGASATAKVLEKSAAMTESEVAALAKFLETKAGGLEGELVRSVESGGPSAVYVAACALAKLRSTSAIPALIEAFQDDGRAGDRERLAAALAEYGDKLIPSLTRAIKRDGPNDHLVLLLTHLEETTQGTLSELSRDRSKNLREAARLARQQRQSRTA